jgi:site-specific DNA-cytosine methylase
MFWGVNFATLGKKTSCKIIVMLQSFPDEFQLIGNYYQQWAVIGNSVPPLFMKAIAEHVRKLLNGSTA